MLIHFIKVQSSSNEIRISFNNGQTWESFSIDNNTIKDIQFSKNKCSNLNDIIIGSRAKHKPYKSDAMAKYFNLETRTTRYTTPEKLGTLLNSLTENTPSTAYSIKIKGVTIENFTKVKSAFNNLSKAIYVNLDSTDFRFCNDIFNTQHFLGEKNQKLLTGITLPEDLTYIGTNTFNGCVNLQDIVIPPLVTDIGRKAFYNCTGLKSVIIPTSVISIDSNAFDCDIGKSASLEEIQYLGSVAKWDQINIDDPNTFIKNKDHIRTITYTISLDDLESFLSNIESSVSEPVPLNITDITSNDSLIKLNNIIRATKSYIDLSSTDLSSVADVFYSMDDDDSSKFIDTDLKKYITSITIPNNATYIGNFVLSGYENLNTITIGSGIKEIRQGAFANCKSLTETIIPPNVTFIGFNAFKGCTNIKLSCTYSESFNSYFNNTGLEKSNVYKITIPTTVSIINEYEFENCVNLSNIELPTTISSIGKGAFKGCSRLKSISVPSTTTVINEETFMNCVNLRTATLPSTIITIKKSAFEGCNLLDTIVTNGETWENDNVFYTDLKEIGDRVFYGCKSLTDLDFSNTALKVFSKYLLFNCFNLKTVKLPESIEILDDYSFCGCNKLQSISLPKNLKTINKYVFYDTAITDISFPTNLNSIGTGAFKKSLLTNVDFPNGFTEIGEECFMDSSIENIILPNTIKYINANAFNGCKNLTTISFPEGFEELGYYCFANCTNLKTVKVPSTVTGTKKVIGFSDDAFKNISKIKIITLPGDVDYYSNLNGSSKNVYYKTVDKKQLPFKDFVFIPDNIDLSGYASLKDLENISDLCLPEGITELGKEAFQNCENLKTIFIPKSLKNIDYYAFNDCINLQSIYYEGSKDDWLRFTVGWHNDQVLATDGTQLLDKNGETLLTLNSKDFIKDGNDNLFKSDVKVYFNFTTQKYKSENFTNINIDEYSFSRDKNYGNITLKVDDLNRVCLISKFNENSDFISYNIDNIIYSFGKGAFHNCPNIELVITYTDDLSNYFQESGITENTKLEVIIPKSIYSIKQGIFKGYTGLRKVSFDEPTDVATINDFAFSGCTGLESISVPKSVNYIGKSAFKDCKGLISIELNENTLEIRESTFENCINLTDIHYPETLQYIRTRAFYNCKSLGYITFYDSLIDIEKDAFYGCSNVKLTCYYNENYSTGEVNWRETSKYLGNTGLTTYNVYKLIITDDKTEIPDDEFINESNPLEGFPNQYKNLHEVVLSKNIEKIGDRAFAECGNLSKVVIPNDSKLKIIGVDAFTDCTALENFNFPKHLVTINDNAFTNCQTFTSLNIPDTVTILGDGAFMGCTSLQDIHIPLNITYLSDNLFLGNSKLKKFNTPVGITSIGESTFYGCTAIDSFTISNIVTSVGYQAFYNDTNIKLTVYYNSYYDSILKQNGFNTNQVYKIHVSNNILEIDNYKFENYKSLEIVDFDNTGTSNVSVIGYGAFKGCSSLTSISLPSSLLTLKDYTFENCTNLSNLIIPSKVSRIASYLCLNNSKLKSITFMGSPIEISNGAFKKCSTLSSIRIPNSVKTLGKDIFYDCTNLSNINIPDNTTCKEIPSGFLHGCSSLTNITFNKHLINIRNGAFYGCSSLISMSIPDGVQYVGNSCFEQCTSLESISFPDSLIDLGSHALYNCTNLTSVKLSNNLTEIGFGTFENCTNLKWLNIPSKINIIEGNVFAGDVNLIVNLDNNNSFILTNNGKGILSKDLKIFYAFFDYSATSVDIPDTVTKIGNGCFKGCYKIKTINLPSKVNNIDEYSFMNCSGLTTLFIPKSVKRIGSGAFTGCTELGSVSGTGIYYKGNETNWSRINISQDGNTPITKPLRIIYNG